MLILIFYNFSIIVILKMPIISQFIQNNLMFLTKKNSAPKQQKPKNKALGGWGDDQQEQDQPMGITKSSNQAKNLNSINLLDNDMTVSNYTAVSTTNEKSSSGNLSSFIPTTGSVQIKRKQSGNQAQIKNINTQNFYTVEELADMNNIQCQCKIVEAVLVPGGIRVKPNDSLLTQFYNQAKSLSIPIVGSLLICHLYNPDAQFQIKAKSLYAIQFLTKKSVQYSVYFKLHAEKIINSPDCQENNENYLKVKKNVLATLGAVVVKPSQEQQIQILANEGIHYVDPGYNQLKQDNGLLAGIAKKKSQKEDRQKAQGIKKLISPMEAKNKQKKGFQGPKKVQTDARKQKIKQYNLLQDKQSSKRPNKNELLDFSLGISQEKVDDLLGSQVATKQINNLTFQQLLAQQNKNKSPSFDFTL